MAGKIRHLNSVNQSELEWLLETTNEHEQCTQEFNKHRKERDTRDLR